MTDRQTMTEVLCDARSKALFKAKYDALTTAQRKLVDQLMQRSTKYAKAVLQLADLIIKIVPSNPEGDTWVLGLHAIAKSLIRGRGL
jgi:hypothetical protein